MTTGRVMSSPRLEQQKSCRLPHSEATAHCAKPVTIWVVRLGDDLYVRSVNGRTSAWFRGTQVRHEGHIQAGGVEQRRHLCGS